MSSDLDFFSEMIIIVISKGGIHYEERNAYHSYSYRAHHSLVYGDYGYAQNYANPLRSR